jgi:hypothetical protein
VYHIHITEQNIEFLKKADECLHRQVDTDFILLRPEFFKMRYRMHSSNVSVKAPDVISVRDSRGNFWPLIRQEEGEDIDIRQQSCDNLRVLQNCGLDLLHSESASHSLTEFENSSLFSAFKKGPRNISNISPHALAVLKFCFSYPPSWALFSANVMRQGDILLPEEIVVSRDISRELSQASQRLWSSGQSAILNVRHPARAGATTLMRSFAWQIANGLGKTDKWCATVFWANEDFNQATNEMCNAAASMLSECTVNDYPIILFADRNIVPSAISRFHDALAKCEIKVLLIRIQRDTDSTGGEAPFRGKREECAVKAPRPEDETRVARMMILVAHYFDPTLNIKKISNVQDLVSLYGGKFKKIMFMGAIDFCTKSGESGRSDVTPEQRANRKIYYDILANWVEQVLSILFLKIELQKQEAMPFSSLSAIRSLSYLALVQLCCPEGTKLDIDSFRIVFDDPSSSEWLFENWRSSSIQRDLLLKSYHRLKERKPTASRGGGAATTGAGDVSSVAYTMLGEGQTWGTLLPFYEVIGDLSVSAENSAPQKTDANYPTLEEYFSPSTSKRKTSTSGSESKGIEEDDASYSGSSRGSDKDTYANVSVSAAAATGAGAGAGVGSIPMRPMSSFGLVERFVALRDSARAVLKKKTVTEEALPAGNAFKKANRDSLHDLFRSLLSTPNGGNSLSSANGNGDDRLGDVEDLLWGELLFVKEGRIRFMTDDIAMVFLEVVLRREYEMSPILGPLHSVTPDHYYVLAMSLLATIQRDTYSVEALDRMSAFDIRNLGEDFGEEDFTLSWTAQRIFTEQQEKFPLACTGLVRDGRKWSWALARMYSGSAESSSMRKNLGCAFGDMVTKVLLAAQCVYLGYWRMASTMTKLMQYRSSVCHNYLKNQRDAASRDVKCSTTALDEDADLVFLCGVKLFLASTGRMLTVIHETGLKDADKKKVAGSYAMIGNSVKSFMNICKMVVQIKYGSEVDAYKAENMDFVVTATMTILMALGNISRYFYKQSSYINKDAVIIADELDCWLSILEAEKNLRTLSSSATTAIDPSIVAVNDMMHLLWGRPTGSTTDFDTFIENLKPPSKIYCVEAALDECHIKLELLNNANMNDLEMDDTRGNWFGQNWDREESYIERLGKLESGNTFDSWMVEFNKRCEEFDAGSEPALEPYLQKRISRLGMCMWQSDQTSNAQGQKKDVYAKSVKFHETMLVASALKFTAADKEKPLRHKNRLITVMYCTIECMNKLQVKYPHHLMTSLMEIVPYLGAYHIRNTPPKYCLYSLGRLRPIVAAWVDSASKNYQNDVVDEYSYAAALRFQSIYDFHAVWANTVRHLSLHGQGQGQGGRNEPLDDVARFHKTNGHIDRETNLWVPGVMQTKFRNFMSFRVSYVMSKCDPIAYDKMCSGAGDALNECPLLVRRQFSIIDTGLYEKREHYEMQLVYGTVVNMFTDKKTDTMRGVVRLKNSTLQLPFQYKSSEVRKLQGTGLPVLEKECSFYVNFLPWKIEAYAVQYRTADNIRVDVATVDVDEGKWKEIEGHNKKKPPLMRRELSSGRAREDPTPAAAAAAVRVVLPLPDAEDGGSLADSAHDHSAHQPNIATVADQLEVSNKLDASAFAELLQFDAVNGTPVRLLRANEFWASNVPQLQRSVYGWVNNNGSFTTPYQNVLTLPNDDCGFVAIPATAQVFPWLDNQSAGMKQDVRVRFCLIWEDVFCKCDKGSAAPAGTKLGRFPGMERTVPTKVDDPRISILDEKKSEGMYILLSLRSWALTGITEGLLALKRRETPPNTPKSAHYDLGVIHFSFMEPVDATDIIKVIWNRSKQLFQKSNWNYLNFVQAVTKPRYVSSDMAFKVPDLSGKLTLPFRYV